MNTPMITAEDARKNMAHLPYLIQIVNDAISQCSREGKDGLTMNLYTGDVKHEDLLKSFQDRGFIAKTLDRTSAKCQLFISWKP